MDELNKLYNDCKYSGLNDTDKQYITFYIDYENWPLLPEGMKLIYFNKRGIIENKPTTPTMLRDYFNDIITRNSSNILPEKKQGTKYRFSMDSKTYFDYKPLSGGAPNTIYPDKQYKNINVWYDDTKNQYYVYKNRVLKYFPFQSNSCNNSGVAKSNPVMCNNFMNCIMLNDPTKLKSCMNILKAKQMWEIVADDAVNPAIIHRFFKMMGVKLQNGTVDGIVQYKYPIKFEEWINIVKTKMDRDVAEAILRNEFLQHYVKELINLCMHNLNILNTNNPMQYLTTTEPYFIKNTPTKQQYDNVLQNMLRRPSMTTINPQLLTGYCSRMRSSLQSGGNIYNTDIITIFEVIKKIYANNNKRINKNVYDIFVEANEQIKAYNSDLIKLIDKWKFINDRAYVCDIDMMLNEIDNYVSKNKSVNDINLHTIDDVCDHLKTMAKEAKNMIITNIHLQKKINKNIMKFGIYLLQKLR
jgi:hypothetical protein